MRKSTQDILSGIGFLVIAIAFWVQHDADEGVSRIYPLGLVLFITAGAVWFILKGFWMRFREKGEESSIRSKTGWKRVGIIIAFSLLYAVGIPTLGFFPSTFLFLFLSYLLLGEQQAGLGKRTVHGLLYAALFSFFIWFGFVWLLNVPVPQGILGII